MKQLIKILALSAITAIVAVTTALGQAGPLITVDELGNGNFNGQPLQSLKQADPFSGIVTLTYVLPFPGVPGDVNLFESGPQPSQPSDVIRFDGHEFMYFFSELEATDQPPFDPADVGLPPPVAGLQFVNLVENGGEGFNDVLYNPAGGLPGDNTAGASYHFISDIPEPGTGLLAALGAGLFLALKSRRQSQERS